MTVVIASGYFDPLHVGHIDYLKKASTLGDRLIVIVNNDEQAKLKKGKSFMPARDRLEIVQALKCVDNTILAKDKDKTVCETLELLARPYVDAGLNVVFAKGGDRTADEIPEASLCKKYGIKIVDGLGPKIRSSSEIVGGQICRTQ